MQSTTLPALDQFAVECESFLSARFEPRRATSSAFVWGEGSDEIVLYERTDPGAIDREVAQVRAWRRELFDHGLGWLTGPVDLGGRGLGREYQAVLDAATRRYDVPGNALLTISIGMIVPTIMRHGTFELRCRYVPAMQRGDVIACQLFSEPSAGSDLASITTRARRDGAGWRISGQKVWTSGAHFSDVGEVICRTGDGGRHRDLTAFLVDMRGPGVTVRPLVQMTGSAAFNEVFFDDVWVPDEDRLGNIGEGWAVALTTLANERGAIGGDGFGGSGLLNFTRLREMARVFAHEGDSHVRGLLTEVWMGLAVAKQHRRLAAASQASGSAPGPEATLSKLMLSANVARIGELASAVLGPRLIADSGEWGTYAWSEVVLGAPGYRIAGGTDEILKNVIAERLLGLPKEPAPTQRRDA